MSNKGFKKFFFIGAAVILISVMEDKEHYNRGLSVDWSNVLSAGLSKLKPDIYRVLKPQTNDELGSFAGSVERPQYTFCTGSSYAGTWNDITMSGFGTYIFPHNVEYEGVLYNGMFHGEGTLSYPMGHKIDGVWAKGQLVSWSYRFSDGLEYESPWPYCKFPDRRFWISMEDDLKPAGREYLTNEQPTRKIPQDCYDTGDGFYNPNTKCVVSSKGKLVRILTDEQLTTKTSNESQDTDDDSCNKETKRVSSSKVRGKVLRVPTTSDEAWIKDNCRKAWDEPVGYDPRLYEHWISGKAYEVIQIITEEADTTPSEQSECTACVETDKIAVYVTNSDGEQSEIDDPFQWIITGKI